MHAHRRSLFLMIWDHSACCRWPWITWSPGWWTITRRGLQTGTTLSGTELEEYERFESILLSWLLFKFVVLIIFFLSAGHNYSAFVYSREHRVDWEMCQVRLLRSYHCLSLPALLVVLFIRYRFHILCSYLLCEEDTNTFDPRMNSENLNKCLLSLKQFYRDLRVEKVSTFRQLGMCPHWSVGWLALTTS